MDSRWRDRLTESATQPSKDPGHRETDVALRLCTPDDAGEVEETSDEVGVSATYGLREGVPEDWADGDPEEAAVGITRLSVEMRMGRTGQLCV
jgi:hypothetical protein